MSYRLKLIITISLLIALSFGIGGTLMITTSFNAKNNHSRIDDQILLLLCIPQGIYMR